MKDPILGDVSESSDGTRRATVTLAGREVSLSVFADGDDPEAAMQLARDIASALPEQDRIALVTAANRLLTTYNEEWRHYSEVDEEGNEFEVTGPELTPGEFIARCTLTGINVTGASHCDFFYANDRLFAGHSVVVQSFDGARSWRDAVLFG